MKVYLVEWNSSYDTATSMVLPSLGNRMDKPKACRVVYVTKEKAEAKVYSLKEAGLLLGFSVTPTISEVEAE